MERLKILVFNWRCWLNPEKGGAEVFTYEVLKKWVKDGHDVTLFTSEFEGSSDEEIVDRVRIVRREGNFQFTGEIRHIIKNFLRKNTILSLRDKH